jgi:hypothetical protein
MKKIGILSVLSVFVLLTTPFSGKSEGRLDPIVPASNGTTAPLETEASLKRLHEIKALDPSTLSRSERQQLRREVRSIKKQQDSGIYLSVGAIIIIILLLILLL